jgi:cell surface protein SprA
MKIIKIISLSFALLISSYAISIAQSTDSKKESPLSISPEYLLKSKESSPLKSMISQKGLFQPGTGNFVEVGSEKTEIIHQINNETREVRIKSIYKNSRTSDTTVLWESGFGEISDYAEKVTEYGIWGSWMDGIAGQKMDDSETSATIENLNVPITLPDWMIELGMEKPKLEIKGNIVGTLGATRTKISTDEAAKDKWLIATPTPGLEANVDIKGKVGEHLTLEVKTTEELGRDNIKIIYNEAFKDEFEDRIVQEVEAGRTSLELPGTELTGYSENHKGLFGIRTKLKFGDWRVTAIASQESGSQESQKLNTSGSSNNFTIHDKDFLLYKYFFVTHQYKTDYVRNYTSNGRKPIGSVKGMDNIHIYTLASPGDSNAIIDATLNFPSLSNRSAISKVRVRELVKMDSKGKGDFKIENRIVYIPRGTRNSVFAWSKNSITSGNSNSEENKLFLFKIETNDDQAINELMLKNKYSVGISEDSKSSFDLKLQKDFSIPSSPLLHTLGLASEEGIIDGDNDNIFDVETGVMTLPCQELSDAGNGKFFVNESPRDTLVLPTGFSFKTLEDKACLEPLRILGYNSIYDSDVNSLNQVESRYQFIGKSFKRSNTIKVSQNQSVSGGGCFDISPDSEKLTQGSTVLEKGKDYEVMYEYGQIELLSERAKDPNKEIDVTYECDPAFSLNTKTLLGLRSELDFHNFAEGSHFGVTALYKSKSVNTEQAYYGNEPYQAFLVGANLRLLGESPALTQGLDYIPFLDLKETSKWRFETEIASSYNQPNTIGSALFDDFENSKREIPYYLKRSSWFKASPAGGTEDDGILFNRLLDYKHQGEFIWHSNFTKRFSDIFFNTGDDRTNSSEIRVLQMKFTPNDMEYRGNSWAGIMKSNSDYASDISQLKYLDIVIQGNVGTFNIDIGRISEDLSIAGSKPDGVLQTEGDLRTNRAIHDNGLDNIPTSEEKNSNIVSWTCSGEDCWEKPEEITSEKIDFVKDDFSLQREESDPTAQINGTEGNNTDKGGYDSEDIDGSGSLDLNNDFVRYTIDLSKESNFEILKSGWRRYRIPLTEYDTLYSKSKLQLEDILKQNKFTRIWVGNLPLGVPNARYQLARLNVVGNNWQASERSSEWDSTSVSETQVIESVNGNQTNLDFTELAGEKDSNSLQVRVISNRDNIGEYVSSPNTTVEKEADNDSPMREQSLVLNFNKLHPEQEVAVTRFFDSEYKDLTQYDEMKMEIHLENDDIFEGDHVRFAIQIGQGSINNARDYYEWSFSPRAMVCPELDDKTGLSNDEILSKLEVCHRENWLDNAFSIPLKNLWPLLKQDRVSSKNGGMGTDSIWRAKDINGLYTDDKLKFDTREKLLDWVDSEKPSQENLRTELNGNLTYTEEQAVRQKMHRSEAISVRGNPSLSRINWIRFVIIVDKDAPEGLSGSFWINDLKLDGVRSGWGYAGRVASQLDLSDFGTLSGDMNYRDGNFASMSENGQLPSLAQARTSVVSRANLNFSIDKFIKKDWGFKIPISYAISSTLERPYMQPNSDLLLSQDKIGDISTDYFDEGWKIDSLDEFRLREETNSQGLIKSKGYQNQAFGQNFGLGYSKEHVKNSGLLSYAKEIFLERPVWNYRYNESQYRSSLQIDTLRNYNTLIKYNLGVLDKKRKFFNPWPQSFEVTFADLMFRRSWNKERMLLLSEDTLDPVLNYEVDLNHTVNMNWKIFKFFSLRYNLDINRKMDRDKAAFEKGNLGSSDNGGLLANEIFFDWDDQDYRYEIDENTIPGDTFKEYNITNFEKTNLGQDYGILRNERNRSQDFKMTFNPNIVRFLTTKVSYSTDFKNSRRLSDSFDPSEYSSIDENYWTMNRNTRFDLRPTFKLPQFFEIFGKNNALVKGLKKLSWNNISLGWSAQVNTQGEEYTLASLNDQMEVSPFNWYLYSIGLGDGHTFRNGWDIMTGDMGLEGPKDHRGFAQYFSSYANKVDSSVYQYGFTNNVKRTASAQTRLTLPIHRIGLNGKLNWAMAFEQSREYPLEIDTVITWPKYSIGMTVPDVSEKFGIRKWIRSMTLNSRFNYTKEESIRPFQSTDDNLMYRFEFRPLVGMRLETKNKIKITNDFDVMWENGTQFLNKYDPGGDTLDYTPYEVFIDSVNRWIYKDLNETEGYSFGDKLRVDWEYNPKGVRFFKWYYRFKNPIVFATTFSLNRKLKQLFSEYENREKRDENRSYYLRDGNGPYYAYVTEINGEQEPIIEDLWTFRAKISADYKFTDKIKSDMSAEYSREADYVISQNSDGDNEPIITSMFTYMMRISIQF